MGGKSKFKVYFFHEYRSLPFPEKHLKETIQAIVKSERNIPNKSINVILCSNYKIAKLNKKYRNVKSATDVLSFFFGDEDFFGEIYISLQKAKIQAKQYKHSYSDEMRRLLVHGFFHLLGFDHDTKKNRALMESFEQKYI